MQKNKIVNFLLKIAYELSQWLSYPLIWMPGVVGVNLRKFVYKRVFFKCGYSLDISKGCYISDYKNIILGNNINIGINAQIYAGKDSKILIGDNLKANSNIMINADCGGYIEIGDNVLIGPNVVLRASNHIFIDKDIPIHQQGHEVGQIIINDDVWLGSNVVVLPNVEIGKGSVVGAGAVVTKNVDEYSIVGGVPAIAIGFRGESVEY